MVRFTRNFDWISAIIILFLSCFGLFLLLTINQTLFYQQLVYLLLGTVLLLIFSSVDPVIPWAFAPASYLLANLLLLLSYFGPTIRGATRWIVIAGVQLQPSELVKPLLLLVFARAITQFPPRQLRFLPLHLGLFLLPFMLVFYQPDFGTSLVYLSFWLGMMLAGGLGIAILFGAGLVMSATVPLIWRLLAFYQKQRILTFLDPKLDPAGAGYNALQAMIAIGSGQLFGRGLGRGTQSHLRFLPEFHTDFIFATLVEEFGFLGSLALFIGYGLLLWRLLSPLVKGSLTEMFPFVYIIGLFTMILTQLFINSGMNMGIIPVTGITLPFVSYGGSSILSLLISFGIFWSASKRVSVMLK